MQSVTGQKLVLASGSPRRKELLATLGIPFDVVTSGISEDVETTDGPVAMVQLLARSKANAVAQKLQEGLVIGSDTTIAFQGEILGKPVDEDAAKEMLRRLRGKRHQVISGIAIIDVATQRVAVSAVTTDIKMRDYSDQEVDAYVGTGEPMDKAGSYAIQGKGGALIQEIQGCYNNVVGMPLCELTKLLVEFGVSPTAQGPVCRLRSGDPCPRTVAMQS